MKWVIAIIALVLLCAWTNANFHNLKHRTGDDILYKLKAGNHDIYLMVFYHPNEGYRHLRSANQKKKKKLENDFLHKNDIKDLYYATIDVTDPKYSNLLYELEIDADELIESPALFIMEHGNGFIMEGPGAVSEMQTNLHELLRNRDQGY